MRAYNPIRYFNGVSPIARTICSRREMRISFSPLATAWRMRDIFSCLSPPYPLLFHATPLFNVSEWTPKRCREEKTHSSLKFRWRSLSEFPRNYDKKKKKRLYRYGRNRRWTHGKFHVKRGNFWWEFDSNCCLLYFSGLENHPKIVFVVL